MPPRSRGKSNKKSSFSHSLSTPNFSSFTNLQPSPPSPSELTPTTNNFPPTKDNDTLSSDHYPDLSDDADFQSHYSQLNSPSSSSSSDSDATPISNPAPPFLHHSNSSFLGPNAFAPPFYNRPPTPLPPSPSLTSLLRPPFSTTTSRPTTPDSSDNETPNDTEAAVAKSARIATTVPRASPKVPTYEYYGFVLYSISSLVFLMYLLWSYLPSPFLHQLGIHYYPNRWWSLAIPSFLVMTLVYIYVALASYNTGYLTLPMNSIENLIDDAANIAVLDAKGRMQKRGSERGKGLAAGWSEGGLGGKGGEPFSKARWREVWSEGTDGVMDVPIGGVCEILYGEGRDDVSDGNDAQDGVNNIC
ncbi:MAG: hypothetical protein L6R40_008756 [Gallowayella cf. fulva]|nr:MAG: hypothetical protein L6R40_008756 [Xanthomendoza cf. fulva]